MSRFLARFTRRAAVRNAEHGEPYDASDGVIDGVSDGVADGASDGVMGGALNGAAHGASIGEQHDPSHGSAVAEADDYIDGAPYDYLRLRITQFNLSRFQERTNRPIQRYEGTTARTATAIQLLKSRRKNFMRGSGSSHNLPAIGFAHAKFAMIFTPSSADPSDGHVRHTSSLPMS